MEQVKIHIPKELFEPAEMQVFEGEACLGELKLNGNDFAFSDPCKWRVEVTNTGGALLIRGKALAHGVTDCVRCLDETDIGLEGDIEGYFVITPEGEDDDMEADEFDALPESHDIDIAPLIVQGLMLDAPMQTLCEPDCKGLCPTCGKNLNDGECDCAHDDVDPANPFAVLKSLELDS